MAIITYNLMPIELGIGFPQRVRTRLENVLYDFTYKINREDSEVEESLVIMIERVNDGRVIYISKLPAFNTIPVYDPDTYELMFYIMCVSPKADNMQVITIPSDVEL